MLNYQTPVDTYAPEIWTHQFYWQQRGGDPATPEEELESVEQLARGFQTSFAEIVALNFRPWTGWPPNRFMVEQLRRQTFGTLAIATLTRRFVERMEKEENQGDNFFLIEDRRLEGELPTSYPIHMTLDDSEGLLETGSYADGWYREDNLYVRRSPSQPSAGFAAQLMASSLDDGLPPLVQLEPYLATRGLIAIENSSDLSIHGR